MFKKHTVVIDEFRINELLERSVENIFPNKEVLKKALMSGKKLSFYFGIDPTGPTIHMGHLIPILVAQKLQNLGHHIILLMGDFTAMIGDPTDKSTTRKQLTRKEVLINLSAYKKQLARFIRLTGHNKAQIVFNSTWLGQMRFDDVVRLTSLMTVDQMLKRDMFDKRVQEGKPIFIHEFLYPLMQGYDSVALDVDGEIGGNDQTFNMLTGRDLMKTIKKKEKFVIATKLLVDPSGKKMGKSEGNMIMLSDSPSDMFGKVMSWSDAMIIPGFTYCTSVPMKNIHAAQERLNQGNNPRDEKASLAEAFVEMNYGKEAAQKAQTSFFNSFSKKEMSEDALVVVCEEGDDLATKLIEANIIPSKSELRRLILAGSIFNVSQNEKVSLESFKIFKSGNLKIGKHRFVRIECAE